MTVILGREAAPGDVEFMREELGLDRPLIVQYFSTGSGASLTGDLGTSYGMGFDIFDQIVRRFGPDAHAHVRHAAGLHPPLVGARHVLGDQRQEAPRGRGRRRDPDRDLDPGVLGGLLFVLVFGVRLGWLPIGGYVPAHRGPDRLDSFDDPSRPALSIGVTAVFTRYVRTAMIDVMNEDFIKSGDGQGSHPAWCRAASTACATPRSRWSRSPRCNSAR